MPFCGRSANNQWINRYSKYHTPIGYRICIHFFLSTPPSDERFILCSGHECADVRPVSHTCAFSPAVRALEQANGQALPGRGRSRRVAEEANETVCLVSIKARRALEMPSCDETILGILHLSIPPLALPFLVQSVLTRKYER